MEHGGSSPSAWRADRPDLGADQGHPRVGSCGVAGMGGPKPLIPMSAIARWIGYRSGGPKMIPSPRQNVSRWSPFSLRVMPDGLRA
jgi:hypothetical protein